MVASLSRCFQQTLCRLEGARLAGPVEQEGPLLRLAFRLREEGAAACGALCFRFDTMGAMVPGRPFTPHLPPYSHPAAKPLITPASDPPRHHVQTAHKPAA